MTTITTRSGKGSPLTNNEVDANFTNLNDDKAELSGAAFTGAITTTSTIDGRDVAADGTKLDGIESGADVTDTANVTAAGALMDSELTSEASVKALNQGVATTDSPTFAGLTTTADVTFGDNDKAIFGAGSDLTIEHNGTFSRIQENGTGPLYIQATDLYLTDSGGVDIYASFTANGAATLRYDNSQKLATTSTGIDVTGTIVGDGLDVTVGTNDRTLLREFNSVNNLSSVNAANSAFRPFEISALGTTISYGGTDTLVTGNNTVNFYLNSGSVSHNFAYNENGGEISLSDETGAVATLLDQSNNNTRLLELIDGSNIQVGLGGANTTGSLLFTKASGAEFGRITGSGYFGINNVNPDTTLHIGDISATNATGQGRIKIEDTSGSLANTGGLEFVTSAFGSGYGWKINSVDSTGVHLDFGTRQNSTTWSDKVRFMWDGRVVIGDTTTNSTANRLKVQGSQGDDRIAMSTASTASSAHIEAQVNNYWSGSTFTGTAIVQNDSAVTGTTSGISNANLGVLRFQNTTNALIYTNGSTSINFGTVGTRRMTLDTSGNFVIGDSTAKTRLQVSGAGVANAPSLGSVSSNVPLYLTNADTAYGLVAGTNNVTGHAWLQAQRTDGTAQAYSITLNEAGGNVGIGSSSTDSKLHVQQGSLGTTAGDSLRIFESSYASSNTDKLEFLARRLSNGSDWQTASQSIQRKVDATLMGYVRFGNNSTAPVSFGNGTTEYLVLDGNGRANFKAGTIEAAKTITSSANAATLNLIEGDTFLHALTENVTYTFSNPAASGSVSSFTLKVTQDTTARTITWPTSVDWAGGTAPTLSTASGAVDIFVFFTHDGGTTYYGFAAGQDMK